VGPNNDVLVVGPVVRHDAALMARDRGADALVMEKSGLYGGSTACLAALSGYPTIT